MIHLKDLLGIVNQIPISNLTLVAVKVGDNLPLMDKMQMHGTLKGF